MTPWMTRLAAVRRCRGYQGAEQPLLGRIAARGVFRVPLDGEEPAAGGSRQPGPG